MSRNCCAGASPPWISYLGKNCTNLLKLIDMTSRLSRALRSLIGVGGFRLFKAAIFCPKFFRELWINNDEKNVPLLASEVDVFLAFFLGWLESVEGRRFLLSMVERRGG